MSWGSALTLPTPPASAAVPWQQHDYAFGPADFVPIYVDGEAGHLENPGLHAQRSYGMWVDAPGQIPWPSELLFDFELSIDGWGDATEYLFGWEGPPEPITSEDWILLDMRPDESKPFGDDNGILYRLRTQFDTSIGAGGAGTQFPIELGFGDSPFPQNDRDVRISARWWVRLRVDSLGFHYRVWLNGDAEPGAWTDESLAADGFDYTAMDLREFAFTYLQDDGFPEDTPPDQAAFLVHSMTIVEGGPYPTSNSETFTRTTAEGWGTSEFR